MAYEVKWPGWEVVDKIGAGSFGAVYRIRREMLGEEEFAALKVISIPQSSDELEELQSQGYDAATITSHFQKYLEDIIKEYSLMRKIKGNTNVVYCDDIQYEPKPDGFGWTIYIKMELLNPLMKNLHQVNSEAQVVKLAKDMCNALELCQEQNIIHRDIKPQNVFISDHGSFKLGDFGIAKTVERTSRGTKIGTYKYMAPEVFHNRPYGHNADIYSLGLLLYWLLNDKRTPFLPVPPQIPTADMEDEAMMRRFRGDPIPAPAHGSPELAAVVMRACTADPAVRYQTAGEMLADLAKIVPSTAPFAAIIPMSAPQNDHTVAAFAAPVNYTEETEGTVSIFGRAPVVPVAPAAPEVPVPAEPKKKKNKKGLVILLVLALVAAIVVTGILLLPKLLGSDDPAEADTPTTQATDPTDAPTDPTDAPTDPTDAPTDPTNTPTEPTDAPEIKVKVPSVLGMNRQQAVKALEDLGLKVELEDEFDQQAAAGTVLSQSVAADTEIESGSTVMLVISAGPGTVTVPNVEGQKQDAATEKLLSSELKVTLTQEYSDSAPEGTVIRQSLAAGSTCKVGAEVTLVISLGKDTIQSIQVSTTPNHKYYLVGDVLDTTGMKIQATYASGKKVTISSGFNCSPSSLNSAGTKNVQVTYSGTSANFTVEVLGNITASGACGNDVRWALQNNGQLTVFGAGEMDPKAVGYENNQPWVDYLASITSVTITDGVTRLSYAAFTNCANLRTVTIADSVTSFTGGWQFAECSKLESIRMPKNATGKIGQSTFMNCRALKEITIPEGITEIVDLAFSGCTSLTNVEIPKNVTAIGFAAFYGTSGMETITIWNPNCAIYSSGQRALGGKEGTVIRGYTGSTAQTYAEKYPTVFVFEALS